MAIILYKPTTHSRRKMSVTDYSVLTKKKPEKSLTIKHQRSVGRDNTGQISVRHKGGGNKRKYRIISFLNDKMDQKALVTALEYDPNRSSFICLVEYADKLPRGRADGVFLPDEFVSNGLSSPQQATGYSVPENKTKAYILAWEGAKVGDEVIASDKTEIAAGNRLRLENVPTGIAIFDLEIHPHQGGKIVKSAGAQAVILSKEGEYVQVKMPSGEIRKFNKKCFASVGQTSNSTHSMVRIGKAGRNRHKGIRPSVRGKAMNPNSHPHGGGEGQNSIGLKYPKTPWGKHALGVRTRKKNKYSNKLIVKRRTK